jgi:hypothetical protein
MRIHTEWTLMTCLLFTLAGCDSVTSLSTRLDGTSDATIHFWARLQGIQWHGNRELISQNDSLKAATARYDVDAVAGGFAQLALHHEQLAARLQALDASLVDSTATTYRDRLVAAHRDVAEACQRFSQAAASRDLEQLGHGGQQYVALLTNYTLLSNESQQVRDSLSAKYDRDFDVAD